MRNHIVRRLALWASVSLALVTFAVVYAMREGSASPEAAQPLTPAACQTMDGIFRPRGVRGKEQLLKHLIDSSDRLAVQSSGDLRQAAELHASYVRLLYGEALRDSSSDEKPGQSVISEATHSEGLKAYDTIRHNAWKRCSLHYLEPMVGAH